LERKFLAGLFSEKWLLKLALGIVPSMLGDFLSGHQTTPVNLTSSFKANIDQAFRQLFTHSTRPTHF
jgi:hypothetical protein